MHSNFKIVSIGAAAALFGGSAAHADIESVEVFKSRYYLQDSAAPPAAPVVYQLESYFDATFPSEVGLVTFDGTPYIEVFPSAWDYVVEFGTKSALDAAFPTTGSYTVEVSGGSLGVRAETLSLPLPENYPAPGVFTAGTMGALDNADPTSDLVIEWSPAAPGTSFVVIALLDVDQQVHVVDFEEPAGSSYLIDASILEPDTDYQLQIIFANGEGSNASPAPGFGVQAEKFTGYITGTVAVFTTGTGAVATDFSAGLLKGVEHEQTNDNAPPGPALGWFFEGFFDAGDGAMAFGAVNGGSFSVPMSEYLPGQWDIDDNAVDFGTKAALDSAFPSNQSYTMDIGGGTLGVRAQTFNIGPDDYPTPAYLTGTVYSDMQGMDASQDFLITWTVPDPGVFLTAMFIDEAATDSIALEIIIAPGESSLLIPAGTLQPGTEYELGLTLVNGGVRPGDGAPAFDTAENLLEGYLTDTIVSFSTGSPCVADFAPPEGVLNFFDLGEFLTLFNAQDPAADLAPPSGVWNFFDLGEFLTLFNQGCP